jgi:hypothetical protein
MGTDVTDEKLTADAAEWKAAAMRSESTALDLLSRDAD